MSEKLKIETGKFYRRRDGKKIGPLYEFDSPPNTHACCGWAFRPNGRIYDNDVSDFDIVAPWTDPTSLEPADRKMDGDEVIQEGDWFVEADGDVRNAHASIGMKVKEAKNVRGWSMVEYRTTRPKPEPAAPAEASGEVEPTIENTSPIPVGEILLETDFYYDEYGERFYKVQSGIVGAKAAHDKFRRRIPAPVQLAASDEVDYGLCEKCNEAFPRIIGQRDAARAKNKELRKELEAIKQAPSVNLADHEREEYRKAIEKLQMELANANYRCGVYEISMGGAMDERDQLQKAIDGYNVERSKILAERDRLRAELAAIKSKIHALTVDEGY